MSPSLEAEVTLREFWQGLLRRALLRAGEPAHAAHDSPQPVAPAPAPATPPSADETAGADLDRARQAFLEGNLDRADEVAAAALRLLERADAPPDPIPFANERRAALESALLAIRGGAAVRAGKLAEAEDFFERSRRKAAESKSAAAIGAAALNLLDLGTRRGRRESDDPLLEEAALAARGTPHEDVLAKLVIERGLAAVGSGVLDQAVALFDRAIALRPAWPFPWYQRAWTRFLRGDASGALDDYRECANRRRPFFTVQREIRCLEDVAAGHLPVEAYRSYCVVRERVRAQPDAVEEAAARLTARHPDFAPAYLTRAEAQLALGNPDAARESAREAMRHDPDPDTAAGALFVEWNMARARGEEDVRQAVEERLLEAYRDSPAAEIVRRLRENGGRDVVMRWTWALDGTFRIEEGLPMRPDEGGPKGG